MKTNGFGRWAVGTAAIALGGCYGEAPAAPAPDEAALEDGRPAETAPGAEAPGVPKTADPGTADPETADPETADPAEPPEEAEPRGPDRVVAPPGPGSQGSEPRQGARVFVAGGVAYFADGDRERVYAAVLDTTEGALGAEVSVVAKLLPGDRPEQLLLDAGGRLHVALAGADEVLTVEPEGGGVRRAVCGGPRALAQLSSGEGVHVACEDGRVLRLSADGEITAVTKLAPGLQDLVPHGGELHATSRKDVARVRVDGAAPEPAVDLAGPAASISFQSYAARVAHRTLAAPGGGFVALHQWHLTAQLFTNQYYAPAEDGAFTATSCLRLVQPGVTVTSADGTILSAASLSGAVVAVDLALLPGGGLAAIALQGHRLGSVMMVPLASVPTANGQGPGCITPQVEKDGRHAVGLAFAGTDVLAIRHVDPPAFELRRLSWQGTIEDNVVVDLPGEPAAHGPGHAFFVLDAGRGVACASCHPDGREDGHTYQFKDGPRRTLPLDFGIDGTAPFHWSGDLSDMEALVDEIYVFRMGGEPPTEATLEDFRDWTDTLEAPAPIRSADDPAAVRGAAIFHDPEVQCATCHVGPALTTNLSVSVGTGSPIAEKFQVPSLVGIAHRAPYMHDGCAPTLHDRFEYAACGGGDLHGHTSQLDPGEIDDLVAYLETL